MEITQAHIAIMEHTKKNGIFCGDSKEMQELCELKMMEFAGKKSFVPDSYYRLMNDGETMLDDLSELGYQPDNDTLEREN
jgi:hypothetical protein